MANATVCPTYDFDAVSVWIHTFGTSDAPTQLSRGIYGAWVGAPTHAPPRPARQTRHSGDVARPRAHDRKLSRPRRKSSRPRLRRAVPRLAARQSCLLRQQGSGAVRIRTRDFQHRGRDGNQPDFACLRGSFRITRSKSSRNLASNGIRARWATISRRTISAETGRHPIQTPSNSVTRPTSSKSRFRGSGPTSRC